MRDISNSWKFKYLPIFGKIAVIKTFMLPQLTHIATVIPSLSIKQMEEIHKIWDEFIQEGSHKVVDMRTVYTPSRDNGLGLHRVPNFWGAVKTSWFRRLLYTKSLLEDYCIEHFILKKSKMQA